MGLFQDPGQLCQGMQTWENVQFAVNVLADHPLSVGGLARSLEMGSLQALRDCDIVTQWLCRAGIVVLSRVIRFSQSLYGMQHNRLCTDTALSSFSNLFDVAELKHMGLVQSTVVLPLDLH